MSKKLAYTRDGFERPIYHNALILAFGHDDKKVTQKVTFDYRDGLLSTKRDSFELTSIKMGENVGIIEQDKAQDMKVFWN